MVSKHYNTKRYNREKFIEECFNDDGHIIDGFIVDKGHPRGAEVHSITDKGIIIVHNLNSGVLVTKLIARPNQIKRVYRAKGQYAPRWLLDIAYENQNRGFNLV
jgi:hypothetical protein